ncbi:MAG: pilus assembly protein N-terminal domain-containing protein [Pseudomonadota bacterium]
MFRSLLKFGLIAVTTAMPTIANAGELWLNMDYVRPYKLREDASRVIVGNPAIADVKVETPNELLLYAIGPGTTNMFIVNEEGEKIEELTIRVRAINENMLIIQTGQQRTTFNCMNNCEPTVTIGDGDSFNRVSQQVLQKAQQALQVGGN